MNDIAKSEIWDIDAEARIIYKKVVFLEPLTKGEAINAFLKGEFDYYDEIEDTKVIKVTDATSY